MAGIRERISICVSLAVAVIDDFSGKPLSGSQVRVWIEGERPPAVKDGGYYIFTNLRQQRAVLHLDAPMFHDRQIVLEEDRLEQHREKPLKIRMIPNRSYPIPRHTTCVQGCAEPGSVVMAYNRDYENPLRLLYAYTAKKEEVSIFHPEDADMEGSIFYIQDKEKKNREIFQTAELTDPEKKTYRMEKPLMHDYKKIGTLIYPVYRLRTDAKGEFYMPLPAIHTEQASFTFWLEGKETDQRQIDLVSGKVNRIDLRHAKG